MILDLGRIESCSYVTYRLQTYMYNVEWAFIAYRRRAIRHTIGGLLPDNQDLPVTICSSWKERDEEEIEWDIMIYRWF